MNPVHVELTKLDPIVADGSPTQWLAAINGGDPVLVLDYAVQRDADGVVALNLVLPVDALSIGETPAGQPAPVAQPGSPETPPRSTWGDGSKPDPRASIPGWEPSGGLGEQVAEQARQMHVTWAPGEGQSGRFVRLLREQIGRNGGAAGVLA